MEDSSTNYVIFTITYCPSTFEHERLTKTHKLTSFTSTVEYFATLWWTV